MVNVPNERFSIAIFDHWEYVLPFGDEWCFIHPDIEAPS